MMIQTILFCFLMNLNTMPVKAMHDTVYAFAEGLEFPEGPAFAPDGSLWAVELKGGRLLQWKAGVIKKVDVGGAPNGIAIDKKGDIWFCDAGEKSIRRYDPLTGQTSTIIRSVNGEPLNKPNDLAFDSEGNLLFTCPGESRTEPTGYAVVLMKNGEVKKITDGKYFPNGLAFTPDGKFLVMAETYKHRLWKGRWNAGAGEWTDATPWCNCGGPDGPGGPDGMCFDASGNLYVAVFGTGKVKMVNSSGEVIKEIEIPGQRPSNCAFDPSGKLGLVVTEDEKGRLISIPWLQHGAALFQ